MGNEGVDDDDDDDGDERNMVSRKRQRTHEPANENGKTLHDDDNSGSDEEEDDDDDDDDNDDDEDEDGGSDDEPSGTQFPRETKNEAEVGIIERVLLRNFMCHRVLDCELGPQMNFIIGQNGSGKSAILTGIIIALGGKASATDRAQSLKSLVKSGESMGSVRVTLRNRGPDGYGSNEEKKWGDKIDIERFIAADGGSRYEVKDASGKIRSKRKDAVDRIVEYMNIQVSNPVSVLTQDRSREFIKSTRPGDRFKYFEQATMVDQVQGAFAHINNRKEFILRQIKSKRNLMPEMESEAMKWEAKFRAYDSIWKSKEKLARYESEFGWLMFSEEYERPCDDLKSDLEKLDSKHKEWDVKLEQSQDEINNLNKIRDAVEEKLAAQNANVTQAQAELEAAQMAKSEDEKNLAKRTHELKGHKRDLVTIQKNIKRMEAELIMKQNERDSRGSNVSAKERQAAEMREEITNLQRLAGSLENAAVQYRSQLDAIKEETEICDEEKRQLEIEHQRLHRELKNLVDQKSNALKKWGDKTPQVLNAIEREKRWHQMPVGPIGSLLHLLESKWARAFQASTGALLKGYVVSDQHDFRLLISIFDSVGINKQYRPFIQQTQFVDYEYDVSCNRTSSQYPTMWDLCSGAHPMVKNVLVDVKRIESIVVIEDRKSCATFMQRNPHNVTAAYILDGSVYKSAGQGGVRFYSNDYSGPDLLGRNVDEQISELERRIVLLSPRIDQVTQRKQQHRADLATFGKKSRENGVEAKRTTQRLAELNADIGYLEDEIRADQEDPEDLQLLEAEITEAQDEAERKDETIERLQEESLLLTKDIEPKRNRCSELDSNMRDAMMRCEEIGNEAYAAVNGLPQAQENLKYYEKKLREVIKHEKIRTDSLEQVQIKAGEVLKATESAFGERITPRYSEKEYESKIAQLRVQIEKKAASTGDMDIVRKNAHEKRAAYERANADLMSSERLCERLEQLMTSRRVNFHKYLRLVMLRTRLYFQMMLKGRGHHGDLDIDLKKRQLYISVKIDGSKSNEKNVSSDGKTLSGGERSFSTLAFIMALWDTMECPFRCMDEFDVYMDMQNRTIALKALIEVSHEKASNQFILITPQQMNNIVSLPSVRIRHLKNPNRLTANQGTLDEFVQNDN